MGKKRGVTKYHDFALSLLARWWEAQKTAKGCEKRDGLLFVFLLAWFVFLLARNVHV